MGKKSQKIKATAPRLQKPDDAVAAAPSVNSWLDTLTEQDRKLALSTNCTSEADLEREKTKLKDREKKAQEAQRQQLWNNEKQKQWEKGEERKAREKDREDRKWQEQFESAKQRALQEGVLESQDYGDGKWWVDLGGGHWQEVQGEYFCTWCDKHLNYSSLEGHLNSKVHKNQVAWRSQNGTGAAASSGGNVAAALVPAPPRCPPCATPVEDWQEKTADGNIMCIPCGKVIDECHLASDYHQNKLRSWQEQQQLRQSGYKAPALPYLALVPDPQYPEGERGLKCLLCNKWVQDEVSHSGTQKAPAGSKEHAKHLRNYGPGDAWYEENVVRERLKYHPNAAPAPSVSVAATARRPASVATPAPWASATVAAPQPSMAEPMLPPGWEAGEAPDAPGKVYYFNRSTGASSWTPPSFPTVETVEDCEEC